MTNPVSRSVLMDDLLGAYEVMRGREEGMSHIDSSERGFWLSFWGVALAGLIDAAAISLMYSDKTLSGATAPPGKAFYVLAMLAIALAAYLVSMLALYLLCRSLEDRSRFTQTMIVHNWAAPVVSVLVLPMVLTFYFTLPDAGGASMIGSAIMITLIAILVLVGIRLIRIPLQISVTKAAVFFAATEFVSLVIAEGLEIFLGLSA